MKRMTHEGMDRAGLILRHVPFAGRPVKKELHHRQAMHDTFARINWMQGIDPQTGRQALAVDIHSAHQQSRELHLMRDKAAKDPNYQRVFNFAQQINQNSQLAEFRDTLTEVYRESLLAEQTRIIRERYPDYHISRGVYKAVEETFSLGKDIASIAAIFSGAGIAKTILEHVGKGILNKMLRHGAEHVLERTGIRRRLHDKFISPKVLDEGEWKFVHNEDKRVQQAIDSVRQVLEHYDPDLARHIGNFRKDNAGEETLEQCMAILYYSQHPQQFTARNRAVASYDFYIDMLQRSKHEAMQQQRAGRRRR